MRRRLLLHFILGMWYWFFTLAASELVVYSALENFIILLMVK